MAIKKDKSLTFERADTTKCYSLSYTVELLQRQHLVKRLKSDSPYRVATVVAAAGYGKSTLLSFWQQYVEEDGGIGVWLSLDNDDS